MKQIKILCIYFIILTLTACTSQSKIDINYFISRINNSELAELTIEEFYLTEENNEFVYKCEKNGILTSLFCGKDGVINQIVLTVEKRNNYFDRMCIESIKAVTDCTQSKELFEKAVASGKAKYSEHQVTFLDYEIGTTVIINKADAQINTNENPTLKGYIDEKNISRPALQE